MQFTWSESFDFDAAVTLQGTFTDWLDVPMTRTKGTHVFYININVPVGVHFYRFSENGKFKNDPQKPTGTDPTTGTICNKLVVDSLAPEQPPPNPLAGLTPAEKMTTAMGALSFQTGAGPGAPSSAAVAKLNSEDERKRRELEEARRRADEEFRAAEEKKRQIEAEYRAAEERRRATLAEYERLQREAEERARKEAAEAAQRAAEQQRQQEAARRQAEEERKEEERLRVEAESRARQARIEVEGAERVRREAEERARRAEEERRAREEDLRKKREEDARRQADLKRESEERMRRNEAVRPLVSAPAFVFSPGTCL